MHFPPAFFDIMVHLIVHIVTEIKWCGPVFLRSMYPFERYMGILKHYVRNRSRPEGSIIEGYGAEEAVEFCVDYLHAVSPIGLPESRHEGRLQGLGTIGKKYVNHERDLVEQAHYHVLHHTAVVSSYIERHKQKLQLENPRANDIWVTKQHTRRFNNWLREQRDHLTLRDPEFKWLARGPSYTVTTWQAYDINGYTFYTRNQDGRSTNQNSGVRIDAEDLAGRMRSYYGYIEEIWELDYVKFKVPLFRCRWVNLSQVKVDKYSFTTVDLTNSAYRDEPFVDAKQVHQVFYVTDPSNKRRYVVRDSKRCIVGLEDVVDDEEYNLFEVVQPSQDEATYVRVDHNEGFETTNKTRDS